MSFCLSVSIFFYIPIFKEIDQKLLLIQENRNINKVNRVLVSSSSWVAYQKLTSATMPIRSPPHRNTSTTLHPTANSWPSIYFSLCLPLCLFPLIFPSSNSFSNLSYQCSYPTAPVSLTSPSSPHDLQNSVVSFWWFNQQTSVYFHHLYFLIR